MTLDDINGLLTVFLLIPPGLSLHRLIKHGGSKAYSISAQIMYTLFSMWTMIYMEALGQHVSFILSIPFCVLNITLLIAVVGLRSDDK